MDKLQLYHNCIDYANINNAVIFSSVIILHDLA